MPIGASSQTNPIEKTPASAEQTGSAAPGQRASGLRSSAEGGRAGLLCAWWKEAPSARPPLMGGGRRQDRDGTQVAPGPRIPRLTGR